METILTVLQQEWALRALAASCMVGLMCGVLGCFIVLRNMSLVGDALSHAILPGVVVAFVVLGYSALGFFIGAVLAGLLAAVAMTWIQQNAATKNDAAVGIVFTAMFSLGVMGISWISRKDGVHLDLKDFLFGNVLGVANSDLYLTAGITVYVLISIAVFYRYLFATTFQEVIAETMGISVKLVHYFLMLLLSFAVVASLQTVGVILVVAMLITPASTALLLSNRLQWVLILSGAIGLASAFFGLIFAIIFETTPGPAMAVTATLFYVLALCFAPEKGLLFRWWRRLRLRRRIRQEDLLKQAYNLHQSGQFSLDRLQSQLGISNKALQQQLTELAGRSYFDKTAAVLTPAGLEAGSKLVRAHRLWETYLADKLGLSEAQVHDEAERYEHLLSEELLDEVEHTLGYPALDPHGEPIPAKWNQPEYPLSRLETGQRAKIAPKQVNDFVASQLWQYGLVPEQEITLTQKMDNQVMLQSAQKSIQLPMHTARQINIQPL